jgi:hypothetical protein
MNEEIVCSSIINFKGTDKKIKTYLNKVMGK